MRLKETGSLRQRLLYPFFSSPLVLTIYLIAIILSIVALELVLIKAGTAKHTGLATRDVLYSSSVVDLSAFRVLRRQDDGSDDGTDDDDTSTATTDDTTDDTSSDPDDPTTTSTDEPETPSTTSDPDDDPDTTTDAPTTSTTDTCENDDPQCEVSTSCEDDGTCDDDPVCDEDDDDCGSPSTCEDDDTCEGDPECEGDECDDPTCEGDECDTNTSSTTTPDNESSTTTLPEPATATSEKLGEATATSESGTATSSSDYITASTTAAADAIETTVTSSFRTNDGETGGAQATSSHVTTSTAKSEPHASLSPLSSNTGPASLFQNKDEPLALPKNAAIVPVKVTKSIMFTATYAAIVVAISFKACWQIVFASMKLNEPFYQLSCPGGADLSTGMSFEFLATGFPIDHFKAGFVGNWTSWYMITSYGTLLLLLLIPSLATEAFSIQNVKGSCVTDSIREDGACVDRVWTVFERPVRTLQIALAGLALLVFVILVIRIRRTPTLHSSSVSLKTISETIRDPATIDLLRDIPAHAQTESSEPRMNRHRFRLDPPMGVSNSAYTLRASPNRVPTTNLTSSTDGYFFESIKHIFEALHAYQPVIDLALPAVIILLLLILIVLYASGTVNDSTVTIFFKSHEFGPKFFLTSIVTLLGISFCRIEYEVRILTTYRSLLRSSAPEELLSRRLHGSPLTQAFASLTHKDEWMCALVSGVAGIGMQVLSIVIGNVPWHNGQSEKSATACIITSILLLILMGVSLGVVAVWRQGNEKLDMQGFEKKLPSTLADVYVLMVHNKIPGLELVGNEKESREDEYSSISGEKSYQRSWYTE